MIATKCAPAAQSSRPLASSPAHLTSSACIWSTASWRVSLRLTPFLHMRLPSVACVPPLASSRPCCAFHAHSSMRVSRASGQPGLLLVGGATPPGATFAALGGTGLAPGSAGVAGVATWGGTDDGGAADGLPPNNPGAKCLAAVPALASSAMVIRPLVSPVGPPGRLFVVVM